MLNLKLLTLNLHCLVEENLVDKQQLIANKIAQKDIDIIFLQEVAQTQTMPIVSTDVKTDNYGYALQQLLKKQDKNYFLYYVPIKQSFGLYDEGVAILSKLELTNHSSKYISKTTDYNNWKSRKILSCSLEYNNHNIYLATTHFGWTDGFEVFEEQVDLALDIFPRNHLSIIAGDFNITPNSKEYKYIIEKGLLDLFKEDSTLFGKPTHIDNMDIHKLGNRIDYIMTTKPVLLLDGEILFTQNPVSDHYGVYAEIELL